MDAPSPKQSRKIDRAVDQLFSEKGFFVARSPADFREPGAFSREILLSDGRCFLLTDLGMRCFKEIVGTLHDANIYGGLAAYGDIWSAYHGVVKDCLSQGIRPDDGAEFVRMASATIDRQICGRTFVVPIFGIELKDVDRVALGSLCIVQPSTEFLDSLGVERSGDGLAKFMQSMKGYLWLIGTTRGTDRIAKEEFRNRAHLATGMLAIIAASRFEHGAHGFRVGTVMTPEEAYGRAQYLSWSENEKALAITHQFTRAQPFSVDPDMLKNIEDSVIGKRAFEILESEQRNDLEQAIVNSVHWYSDAHRDEVLVMRLLKYWSCIETFFSGDQQQITKSVAAGVAATLTHGGLGFAPPDDYVDLRRRLTKLYGLRSRAAHRASFGHVSTRDAADLSQWISWLILTAIAFVERGTQTTEQLASWTRRVDKRYRGTRAIVAGITKLLQRITHKIKAVLVRRQKP